MIKKLLIIVFTTMFLGVLYSFDSTYTRYTGEEEEEQIEFAAQEYQEQHKIPEKVLPDFTHLGGGKLLKVKFFEFLRPIIEAENAQIRHQREFVVKSYAAYKQGWDFTPEHIARLKQIATYYKLRKMNFDNESDFRRLLMRVDEVPLDLALVQGAVESAWGTSYFAREGNNIFGQWCFTEGCGLVPRGRVEGASHEVKVFGSVNEAVSAYMRNLNTHRAYKHFRNLRYDNRQRGEELKGAHLALGLQKYSAKGMEYVTILRTMLNSNQDVMAMAR